jgi:hypothetical protein
LLNNYEHIKSNLSAGNKHVESSGGVETCLTVLSGSILWEEHGPVTGKGERMWRNNIFKVLILSCFMLSLASTVSPWDGQRQGFILGGGLGYGMISFDDTLSSAEGRQEKGAFMTDVKIGYAQSNQVAIYFTNKSAWFSRDAEETETRGDDLVLSSFTGGGLTYYFKSSGSSLFASTGIGVLSWRSDRTGTYHGYGFFVGGGYEFIKHFSGELNLIYGYPWKENSVVTIMATINILGF